MSNHLNLCHGVTVTHKLSNVLDASRKLAYIGRAAFNSADGIGLPNIQADKPLPSGFFTSVNTIAASFMAGRGGGYFGSAGFLYAGRPTLLRPATFDWSRSGGLLNPIQEASTMPKHARVLFSYCTVILLTLALERGASVAVILATLATFALVHAIGGASHE